ncbi:MAG: FAD-dependent oxidoreductase [Gammaproteobacteria bacterium]|nr:FAD-dependent oxidoreductase [Gammaproteobacteria bacterium]MDH3372091.1 FAD-dependent oxidoreductase [Gammaproteobacteria bacterium]MDH3408418.1 FAD-dependent oxidoreductase [Gammaproteobacteria bacterium]
MTTGTVYDLVVIGGGAVGLSTAYHAAGRQWRTLVIEQFGFLNDQGSSAGASRQFRVQYSQHYMSELALSAIPFWNDIQRYSSDLLKGHGGSLWFGDPALSSQEGGIQAAMNTMDSLGIAYTALANAAAIESAYPFRGLPSDYSGFFQPDGGIINLKATERALFQGAEATGPVEFHDQETVIGISSVEGGVIEVTTDKATYTTQKLAITPGPYVNVVLAHLGLSVDIEIWEMSSAYYRKTDPQLVLPTWFVFQEPQNTSLYYGFPEVDWAHPGYIRVAPDIPDKILTDPSQRNPDPSEKSLGYNEAWVRDHMMGLDSTSEFTSTCLIALSSGAETKELLLDYAPGSVPNAQSIVTYSAGWAAKFIPILGEMICQMLADEYLQYFEFGDYRIDRSNFAINWGGPDTAKER